MNEENRFRQLSLFSVIVAELLIVPSGLGGGIYLLTQKSNYKILYAGLGVMLGLGLAIYRIFLMSKRLTSEEGKK